MQHNLFHIVRRFDGSELALSSALNNPSSSLPSSIQPSETEDEIVYEIGAFLGSGIASNVYEAIDTRTEEVRLDIIR